MSNFIRFDRKDIQTIIGMVDELTPATSEEKDERRPEEIELYNKACSILELMNSSEERQRPTLFRDEQTGRLTIQYGENLSEPVPYNGIAVLGNFFAVTDYYQDIFPTNVLLRFMHVNAAERMAWEQGKKKNNGEKKVINTSVKKPRWRREPSASDS